MSMLTKNGVPVSYGKNGARFVQGVGMLQPDEHWNMLEELSSDANKVTEVIKRVQRLALEATINIPQNPHLAIRQMDQVNEGVDILVRLWGVH